MMNLKNVLAILEQAAIDRRNKEVHNVGVAFHDDDTFSPLGTDMLTVSEVNKLRKYLTRVPFGINEDKKKRMMSLLRKVQASWPHTDGSAHEAWHTIIQVACKKGYRIW